MNPRKLPTLHLGLGALALSLSGCLSPGLMLDFNDRWIIVERLDQATFPRGLEISSFDGTVMKVSGKEPIKINERELTVKGSRVTYGEFSGSVSANQKLVVKKNGGFDVSEHDPNEKPSKSWWQFWR